MDSQWKGQCFMPTNILTVLILALMDSQWNSIHQARIRGKKGLNPCSYGQLVERDYFSAATGVLCLNPCSYGQLVELRLVVLYTRGFVVLILALMDSQWNILWQVFSNYCVQCLNPCSYGQLVEQKNERYKNWIVRLNPCSYGQLVERFLFRKA